MPRIYRVMKPDEDGKPVVGRSSTSLGVRVYGERNDIRPVDGLVGPGLGGMSVSPSLQTLPEAMLPERLRHLVAGARGSNAKRVWRMGQGPFEPSVVAPSLALRPDSPIHGVVEAVSAMPLEEYEAALAQTRDSWVVDESGG